MNWTISQHVFRCGCCDAWVAQGERIARVRLRWWCQSCADRLTDDSVTAVGRPDLLESDSKEVASTGDPAGADRA